MGLLHLVSGKTVRVICAREVITNRQNG